MNRVVKLSDQIGVPFTGLAWDSRQVQRGELFFCLPGVKTDGHQYAAQAVVRGAAALVVEHKLPLEIPQLVVPDARVAMAEISAEYYDHPASRLKLVAIGGTKGKTSTTYLAEAACSACGITTGVIGNLGVSAPGVKIAKELNTPEAPEMQRILKELADHGVKTVFFEATAHGLDMHRLDAMSFDVGVLTNFAQDHLDYFGTMDDYAAAKKKLYADGRVGHAVINLDSDRAEWFVDEFHGPVTTYGISRPGDMSASDITIRQDGVSFRMTHKGQLVYIDMRLSGLFNVYNAMAASCACRALGMPLSDIARGISECNVVPGRAERLPVETPYTVILDYAHTPESLMSILENIRRINTGKGRLIAVFGCGGDRDRGKRPIMGRISGQNADEVILTSDNPRTEEPMDIIAEIEAGIKETGTPYKVIENRREAIAHALSIARKGDIVLLAGKGHETYQEINGEKYAFDERVVVRDILAGKSEG